MNSCPGTVKYERTPEEGDILSGLHRIATSHEGLNLCILVEALSVENIDAKFFPVFESAVHSFLQDPNIALIPVFHNNESHSAIRMHMRNKNVEEFFKFDLS